MDNLETHIVDLENQVKRLTMLVDRIYSYTHLGIHKPSFANDEKPNPTLRKQ